MESKGKVFSLEMQVEQFLKVKEEIEGLIGKDATSELLSKSLFVVVTGSNDWVNTYFFPGSPLPKLYTVPQYRDLLLQTFFSHVRVCATPNIARQLNCCLQVFPLQQFPYSVFMHPPSKCVHYVLICTN